MATALLSKAAPEETISCPYNKAHQILRSRMQTHLVKCRKENEGKFPLKDCPYNAVHRILDPEWMYHIENCPDREKLDKFMMTDPSVVENKYPLPQYNVQIEENWDSEEVPTYNPDAYCTSNNVLRQMKVKSAAKRRNFRYEERQRHQQINAVKEELSKTVRESASDFARRQPAEEAKRQDVDDIDEDDDPYEVKSLVDRIRNRGMNIQSKTSEEEEWQTVERKHPQNQPADSSSSPKPSSSSTEPSSSSSITKPSQGKGRGRYVKQNKN